MLVATLARRARPARLAGLLLAAAAGAQSVQVSAPMVAGGDVRSFQWSADGVWLAYVADSDQDEVDELYSVELTAGNFVRKLNPPLVAGGDVASTPERLALSADSQWAVYLADQNVPGRRELFRVALDGNPPALVLSHALAGSATVEDFQLDPLDVRIAYRASSAGFFGLYSVRLDASQAAFLMTSVSAVEYRVSPDGARVVLKAPTNRLLTAPLAGGTVLFLSPSGTPAGRFEFSPDGRWVVHDNPLTTFNPDQMRVYGEQADGLDHPFEVVHNFLTSSVGAFRFEVGSQSRRVVYIEQDFPFGWNLHSVPIAGEPLWPGPGLGGAVPLRGTTARGRLLLALGVGDGLAGGLSFRTSPDGKRVAYLAGVGGDPELFAVPVNGPAGAQQLTNDVAVLHAFRFSPDSARLVYLAELESSPGITRLFSVPADGSAARVELSGAFVAGGEIDTSVLKEPFEISPDSTQVVYRADQTTDDVFELYARALDGSGSPVQLNGALVAGGDVGGAAGDAVLPAFRIEPDSLAVVYAADQDQDEQFELFRSPLP